MNENYLQKNIRIMNRKTNKILIGIFSVAMLILVSFIFFFNSHPVISYDKTIFTDHQNSFETAVKTCIEYHKKDDNADDFQLYDIFGLDENDISNEDRLMDFGILAGFRAWYILQHYDEYAGNYKPFITYIEFEETIQGNI